MLLDHKPQTVNSFEWVTTIYSLVVIIGIVLFIGLLYCAVKIVLSNKKNSEKLDELNNKVDKLTQLQQPSNRK